MPWTKRDAKLRGLYLEQALGWSIAWLLGIGSLFVVAVLTHWQLSQNDMDAELGLLVTAYYGLTWIDEDGRFHDEDLQPETDVLEAPYDVWVVAPGTPEVVHYQPPEPRFQVDGLGAVAATVVATRDEVFEDGFDLLGKPYRLHGYPTFSEDGEAIAAILALGDPTPWSAAHEDFVTTMAVVVLLLVGAGWLVGVALSRRALQPVLDSLERQERFLAAAAHELRTPVASLRAVSESAGEEDAVEALQQVSELAQTTGTLVEQLLLMARLDGADLSTTEPVRLDLLVEAMLPEDGSIPLEAEASVVRGDAKLLQTAVRNLVENAKIHGSSTDSAPSIQVTVQGGEVCVEDEGPGFAEEMLHRAAEPFVASSTSPGTGLGLAIVGLIAQLHGGNVELTNRPEGGARVTFTVHPRRVS